MKHAGSATLDALEDLIAAIRTRVGVKERQRGVFYRKGRAFLHFHEDPIGLYADIRTDGDWTRLCVSDPGGRDRLLAILDETLRT
jgi:hypothetical protein